MLITGTVKKRKGNVEEGRDLREGEEDAEKGGN